MQKCYLTRKEHIPEKALFPVIDAHNHLWGKWDSLPGIIGIMDAVGVVAYADLTANVHIEWGQGGYVLGHGSFDDFLARCVRLFPNRFFGFTTATFARPVSSPLFQNAGMFTEETIQMLKKHVQNGARGLKILKELGLHYRDSNGNLVNIDDERLAPVWEEAGRLGVPVLMHQADPVGFFDPVTPDNEHYDSLRKYPDWSFADPKFPRFQELLERRDRVVRRHPHVRFILPHVANYPENLSVVASLLDECPNVFIDFSARLDELGRQPYAAHDFFIRYQDRILFGADMPPSLEIYRCYFRFLETSDEYFVPPDYDGTFTRYRWRIHGLGLSDKVLKKIYYQNALKIIPGLAADFKSIGNG